MNKQIIFILSIFCTSAVKAEGIHPELLYGCSGSQFIITENTVKKDALEKFGYTVEEISVSDLILYKFVDDIRGRSGSKTLTRQCGAFKIAIRGDFFNANPWGELGDIEYPVISIFFHEKLLANKIALGECVSGLKNTRFSSFGEPCPEGWATEISPFGDDGTLEFKRSYGDYRSPP